MSDFAKSFIPEDILDTVHATVTKIEVNSLEELYEVFKSKTGVDTEGPSIYFKLFGQMNLIESNSIEFPELGGNPIFAEVLNRFNQLSRISSFLNQPDTPKETCIDLLFGFIYPHFTIEGPEGSENREEIIRYISSVMPVSAEATEEHQCSCSEDGKCCGGCTDCHCHESS